uniref:Single-strand DNA-binding protein n=1 Tax=Candidatus Kentrum sp. SD TaxID=2126332 RepID=A0A451BS39_9GAMM|nr:MAG: single-strand DNA-binding protein [Candidatus Kentron sp. SD]
MTNRITVYGHLGKDSEIKEVNGKKILVLSVASSHKTKASDVTVWRRVTFWDDSHQKLQQYLKKGSAVVVYGMEQPPTIYNNIVQLEVIGKDLSFNPFGGKKKEENTENKSQGQDSGDDLSQCFG